MAPTGGGTTVRSLGSTQGLQFRWVRRARDVHGVARAAADEVLRLGHEAVEQRGVFRVALSAGRTMRPLHELVARSTTARFDRWHFYWVDETCVAPDHERSHFLMAQETLLGRLELSHHQLHRIPAELGSPAQVAEAYEDELRYSFGVDRYELPRFDCVLLGLGEDGAVGSLFPDSPALEEEERLVVANWDDRPHGHRVTLTLPALNAARAVIHVVSGATKAPALAQALGEGGPERQVPSRGVCPQDGTVLWVVDEAAAAAASRPEEDYATA